MGNWTVMIIGWDSTLYANRGHVVIFEQVLQSRTALIETSTTFDPCSLYCESSPQIHRGIVPEPGLSAAPGKSTEDRNLQ